VAVPLAALALTNGVAPTTAPATAPATAEDEGGGGVGM
jgi:hypothetical protein